MYNDEYLECTDMVGDSDYGMVRYKLYYRER